MRKIEIILIVCFFVLIIFVSHDASAESLLNTSVENVFGTLNWQPDALNSDSEVIGNYEVIVTTDPIIPEVDQVTHIQFKVFNYNQGPYRDNKLNYAEMGVNHFTMGVRVYHNDILVHEFLPQYHDGSSWSTDYAFTQSGNHVLRVDLYNFDKNNDLKTYVFNVPVSTKFGPVFQYILVAAVIAFAIILIWVGLTMKRRKTQHL
jgi:hypothetical protein